MADAITIKALQDASLDAKSLEEVVNGDEEKQVTTRLGETYPSVKKAITQMFENGGLPATPFATKALMTASALIDGKYAQVTDDTVNNGLYVKTAGAWVKSNYDPLTQAKTYADTHKADTLLRVQNVFATKTLMTESALVDGSNAQVNNDTTADNNGFYKKTAGAWVKSGYDPIAQANAYTDEAILPVATQNMASGGDLEIATDVNGKIYRRVDADGATSILGLDRTIQDEIAVRSSGIEVTSLSQDIERLIDKNGAIVRRTDNRGALYIASGKGSVQHFTRQPLSDDLKKYTYNSPEKLKRESYSSAVKSKVADLQNECLPYIEPPLMLVPNMMNIPNSVLSEIVLSDDNPVAQLPFPYTDGGSVHPYALQLRKPLYGYRNLLLDSNHKWGTEGEETSVMFGTNDWVHFDLIPDVKQPMMNGASGTNGRNNDGFMSDPWFSYDLRDGALIYGTRKRDRIPSERTYFYMTKTYDGINWTKRKFFEIPDSPENLSSTTLYDPTLNTWHLWTIAPEGTLRHYTSSDYLGSWTLISTNNRENLGFIIWHAEVKYVGDKFALCAVERGSTSQVYLGFSDDGDNWTMSGGLVQPQSPSIYKSTFITEFDGENKVRFIFMWAHWEWIGADRTKGEDMQLYVQKSNWINI